MDHFIHLGCGCDVWRRMVVARSNCGRIVVESSSWRPPRAKCARLKTQLVICGCDCASEQRYADIRYTVLNYRVRSSRGCTLHMPDRHARRQSDIRTRMHTTSSRWSENHISRNEVTWHSPPARSPTPRWWLSSGPAGMTSRQRAAADAAGAQRPYHSPGDWWETLT